VFLDYFKVPNYKLSVRTGTETLEVGN